MKSRLSWEEKSGHWLLTKVLRYLMNQFQDEVRFGRFIKKQRLYLRLQWRFHFTREESQVVLRDLANAFIGIRFSNQGLRISSAYLDRETWTICDNNSHEPFTTRDDPRPKSKHQGGESSGVAR